MRCFCPPVSGHPCFFYFFPATNIDAVCVRQKSAHTPAFFSSRRISRHGMDKFCVNFVFNSLRKLSYTMGFHSNWVIFCSYQQHTGILISPDPLQYLLLSIASLIAILMGVQCISLSIPNDELWGTFLHVHLLSVCLCWLRGLLISLVHIVIEFFAFLLLTFCWVLHILDVF